MADLFTLEELASYLQQNVDTASATLARSLATGLVKRAAGGHDFTADTTVPDEVKAVALAVTGRIYGNPRGVTGENIGSYSYRVAETGTGLTDDERRIVAAAAAEIDGTVPGVTSLTLNPDTVGTDFIYIDVEGSDRGLPAYPTSWTDGGA